MCLHFSFTRFPVSIENPRTTNSVAKNIALKKNHEQTEKEKNMMYDRIVPVHNLTAVLVAETNEKKK